MGVSFIPTSYLEKGVHSACVGPHEVHVTFLPPGGRTDEGYSAGNLDANLFRIRGTPDMVLKCMGGNVDIAPVIKALEGKSCGRNIVVMQPNGGSYHATLYEHSMSSG